MSNWRGEQRNSAIDVLRGWAVLVVILLHINIRVHFDDCALGQWLSKPLYSLLFWSGYQGVIVFFVVSGFLITRRIIERWGKLDRVALGAFYRLRFARIAPMLVLFVLVQALLQSARVTGFSEEHPAASLPRSIFAAFAFHLNWLEAKFGYLPGAWDVLWSLSVEELFYLGFPLVTRVVKPRLALSALLVAFAAVGPFARVWPSSNEMWQDHSYLSCMGEIAIGCLAASLLARRAPSKHAAYALLVAGAGMMLLVFHFRSVVAALGLYRSGLYVTVLSLGTAAVLVAVTAVPSLPRVTDRALFAPLRVLGENSYEVYLSHLFVILPAVLVWKRVGVPSLIPFFYLAVLVGCALLGALLAKAYSKPLNALLRARSKPPTPAT